MEISSNELWPILQKHSEFLELYRQLPLKDEDQFASWAFERGIHLSAGTGTGDVELFWEKGWLRADSVYLCRYQDGIWPGYVKEENCERRRVGELVSPPPDGFYYNLFFHPFRLLTPWWLLNVNGQIASSCLLFSDKGVDVARWFRQDAKEWTESPEFCSAINRLNGISDIAILLEPLLWPTISGRRTVPRARNGSGQEELQQYRAYMKDIIRQLGEDEVRGAHELLRTEAGRLDRNGELYLLLRSTSWSSREKVVGPLGGALWLRHLAEVIRLGFEKVFEGRLPDEDVGVSLWPAHARKAKYGDDHAIDNIHHTAKRIQSNWRAPTGVQVRWYVEGKTEKAALEALLGDALGRSVEVIHVDGSNWGSWLLDELRNDLQAERFSMIMLDSDEKNNIRSVKNLAAKDLIVGDVILCTPDFEFGCFNIDQLCRAAESLEVSEGRVALQRLRRTEFASCTSGKAFEATYKKCRQAQKLKGFEWGKALARVSSNDLQTEDYVTNPLWNAVWMTSRITQTTHQSHKQEFRIDPETLELTRREPAEPPKTPPFTRVGEVRDKG